MPKKFRGENSKAAAARDRRAEEKQAVQERKRKEEEDSYWRDDDKQVARKQERKVQIHRWHAAVSDVVLMAIRWSVLCVWDLLDRCMAIITVHSECE